MKKLAFPATMAIALVATYSPNANDTDFINDKCRAVIKRPTLAQLQDLPKPIEINESDCTRNFKDKREMFYRFEFEPENGIILVENEAGEIEDFRFYIAW